MWSISPNSVDIVVFSTWQAARSYLASALPNLGELSEIFRFVFVSRPTLLYLFDFCGVNTFLCICKLLESCFFKMDKSVSDNAMSGI